MNLLQECWGFASIGYPYENFSINLVVFFFLPTWWSTAIFSFSEAGVKKSFKVDLTSVCTFSGEDARENKRQAILRWEYFQLENMDARPGKEETGHKNRGWKAVSVLDVSLKLENASWNNSRWQAEKRVIGFKISHAVSSAGAMSAWLSGKGMEEQVIRGEEGKDLSGRWNGSSTWILKSPRMMAWIRMEKRKRTSPKQIWRSNWVNIWE